MDNEKGRLNIGLNELKDLIRQAEFAADTQDLCRYLTIYKQGGKIIIEQPKTHKADGKGLIHTK